MYLLFLNQLTDKHFTIRSTQFKLAISIIIIIIIKEKICGVKRGQKKTNQELQEMKAVAKNNLALGADLIP